MKDKELKVEETESSLTLGGVSNTLKCIKLVRVVIGLVVLMFIINR
jgi:hypothetical protein